MPDDADKRHIGRAKMLSGWQLNMSDQTEYFTKNRGWVRSSDLAVGDKLDICAQDDEVVGFTIIDDVMNS